MVMAVGAGAFYLPDLLINLSKAAEISVAAPVTGVEAVCGKGWQSNLPNVDQMHCYMTDTVSRLCEPKEKARLVEIINQFDDDFTVWQNNIALASFGAAMKTNVIGSKCQLKVLNPATLV